jgi:phage major head subunit gpT-like protein
MGQVVNPVILEKLLKTEFFRSLAAIPENWKKIATVIPSTSDQEKYGFVGENPAPREWTDERIPKGLADFNYTIVNKHFESSIRIDRDALEDDKTSQLTIRANGLARKLAAHPEELVVSLLNVGLSTLCYDGQLFFDTDHADPGAEYQTAQDNDLTKTVVAHGAPTVAEVKAIIAKLIEAMMQFKDDRGKPFYPNWSMGGLIVLTHPAHAIVLAETLNSTIISDTTNVLKGVAEAMVSPFITDDGTWILLRVDDTLKPIIFQNRQEPRTVQIDDEMKRFIVFGADARYNVGFGNWRNACLCTVSNA